MLETVNVLETAQRLIDEAASRLGLDAGTTELLREPMRVLTVRIPVRMDDGSIRVFTGYRSQHNDALGPTKGGLRFHPDVSLDEVKALSVWMSLKCSILGLPYGGAKGAIKCNPKELSRGELERLSRGYIRAVAQIIGPEKDIPAPDVYTNPQVMAWMVDEFSALKQFNNFGLMTGKPLVIGGSAGRNEATARGCLFAVREAAATLGLDIRGSRVAIQGFGNAGSIAAQLFAEDGAKVIAVSDSKGSIYDPNGLDPDSVIEFKQKTGSVRGYPGSKEIGTDELLMLDCDILIPAALENQITPENAPGIRAKIVAEAANGPTTPKANEILYEKGVLVLPDVYCSAGGVTVSYFEWVQNNMGYYWSEDEVNQKLELMMRDAFRRIYDMSRKHKVDMRMAAYMVGIARIVEGMKVRGWS